MCSGYGIAFDSARSWSSDNDIARNVIIFGVDKSVYFGAHLMMKISRIPF